ASGICAGADGGAGGAGSVRGGCVRGEGVAAGVLRGLDGCSAGRDRRPGDDGGAVAGEVPGPGVVEGRGGRDVLRGGRRGPERVRQAGVFLARGGSQRGGQRGAAAGVRDGERSGSRPQTGGNPTSVSASRPSEPRPQPLSPTLRHLPASPKVLRGT